MTKSVYGTHIVSIDSKARIALPKRVIDDWALKDNAELVLVQGPSSGIEMYLPEQWQGVREELENLYEAEQKTIDEDRRNYFETTLGSAAFINLDSAARMSIPEHLRIFADIEVAEKGIRKGIYIMGQKTHYKIWTEENWKKRMEKFKNNGVLKYQNAVNTAKNISLSLT